MPNIDHDLWHWYHNVSECNYHIQLTIKYRKAVLEQRVIDTILLGAAEGRGAQAMETILSVLLTL